MTHRSVYETVLKLQSKEVSDILSVDWFSPGTATLPMSSINTSAATTLNKLHKLMPKNLINLQCIKLINYSAYSFVQRVHIVIVYESAQEFGSINVDRAITTANRTLH